jgi:hypothetical protein
MKIFNLHKSFFHVLLIVLLGLIAYMNTFDAPFYLDGQYAIADNPMIKNLQNFVDISKAKLYEGHFGYPTFKRRYVGYLTFALNYKFHGLNVVGFHLTNIAIHISTALLLYIFVTLTMQTPLLQTSLLKNYTRHIALFTALLFVCHPLQTGAVTYIWQRLTSLASLLYLLSFVAYVKWRLSCPQTSSSVQSRLAGTKGLPWYGLSIIAAVFAMKTKEITFMLPLVIALYEFVFFQGRTGRRLLYLVPLLLTMLIIPLTLFSFDKPAVELMGHVDNVTRGHTHLSRWEYLTTSMRVITTYIRLIFLPIHLNFDYDYKVYRSFFDGEIIISLVFILSIFGLAVYLFSRYRRTAPQVRLISFGIFWFFFNLLLESSIIPLNQVIFEHRVYLPSMGIFPAVMVTIFTGVERLKNKGIHILTAVTVMLSFTVIVLTTATYIRNSVWKDEASLWGDVVSKSPNKFFPHYNLGNAYLSQGLFDKAMEEYQITINLFPSHVKALISIGNIYMSLGQTDKAIAQYMIALKYAAKNYVAHYNLGLAYKTKGHLDKAREYLEAAEKLKHE